MFEHVAFWKESIRALLYNAVALAARVLGESAWMQVTSKGKVPEKGQKHDWFQG